MAEVIADLSRVTPVLKEFYLKGILMQLPEDYAFFSEVKSAAPDRIEGKYAVMAVQVGRNHGGGPRAENAVLPDPGSVEFANMRVNAAYETQLTSITQQTIDASASDKGSFARQLNAQIEGCGDAISRRMSRWLCSGDGSACLANCAATTASTTISLADGPQGFATQHLEEGMIVDIRTRSSGTAVANGTGRTIESIDHSAKTITLDTTGGNVTTSTSEGLYLENSRNLAPMGMLGICSASDPGDINTTGMGSLQNTAVASNSWFKAVTRGSLSSKKSLTIDDLNLLWLTIETRTGARKAGDYAIWSRPELWHEYGMLITPDRRYMAQDAKTDAGHAYLEFNGIKWKYDRDFAPYKVFFHNKRSTVLLQMGGGMRWVEKGGEIWHWALNTLSYKACLYWFCTLAVQFRNRNGLIDGAKMSEITAG